MPRLALFLIVLVAAPVAAQEDPRAALEAAASRYATEPPVEVVVEAAVARLRTDAVEDALRRARLAGLLPTLTGALRRGQAIDLSALTTADGERRNLSTDDDLVLEARAVFSLDRLLFAAQEPSLLRERRALEQRREQLIAWVVGLYFERRRLQLERDVFGRWDATRAARVLEIEALLDLLSGGAMRR
jgi:hypothetical protein